MKEIHFYEKQRTISTIYFLDIHCMFTLADSSQIWRSMKIKCIKNTGYESSLTVGKEYEVISVCKGILTTPYVSFINDKGREGQAYTTRFILVNEEKTDEQNS